MIRERSTVCGSTVCGSAIFMGSYMQLLSASPCPSRSSPLQHAARIRCISFHFAGQSVSCAGRAIRRCVAAFSLPRRLRHGQSRQAAALCRHDAASCRGGLSWRRLFVGPVKDFTQQMVEKEVRARCPGNAELSSIPLALTRLELVSLCLW